MDDDQSSNQENFALADTGPTQKSSHSDEEVFMLATSRPKKRAGRKIFKETRHPIFRGVRRRNNDKWVCELREPNKQTRLWLGTYPTPEMAARAHDVAALALRGRAACLNFADSAWKLPVPVSTDAKDIRKAATDAAELFRPREFGGEVRESLNCDGDVEMDVAGIIADMADGPLHSPPRYGGDCMNLDDVDSDVDVSLWSYSI